MCLIRERSRVFQGVESERRFRDSSILKTSLVLKNTISLELWKRLGLWVLLFLFPVTGFPHASSLQAKGSSVYLSNILSLPPGYRAIVVDKSRQTLFLVVSERDRGLKIERKTICATGEADGEKKVAGDMRTPEGIYFCTKILIPPWLGVKYGVCAFPLNYPNTIDRRHCRYGNGIWIHGIHEDRKVRSTQGCVVMQNDDLEFLARRIRLYTTPVVISGQVRFASKKSIGMEAEELFRFLNRWQNAWVTGDINAYIACYAPTFVSRGFALPQWRSYKSELFKRYHHLMVVEKENPVVVHSISYDVVAFMQTFRGGPFKSVGYKRLYLQKDRNGRRIIGEEWIPLSVLEEGMKSYTKSLALLTQPKERYRITYVPPGEEMPQIKKVNPNK